MSMYTPFTYLITHKSTGKRYYGVRYKQGCSPSDIGQTYFSSSRLVNSMIQEQGIDAFSYEVRRTFNTAAEAIAWEQRVLTRLKVSENDHWLNVSSGPKTKAHSYKKTSRKSKATIEKNLIEQYYHLLI